MTDEVMRMQSAIGNTGTVGEPGEGMPTDEIIRKATDALETAFAMVSMLAKHMPAYDSVLGRIAQAEAQLEWVMHGGN